MMESRVPKRIASSSEAVGPQVLDAEADEQPGQGCLPRLADLCHQARRGLLSESLEPDEVVGGQAEEVCCVGNQSLLVEQDHGALAETFDVECAPAHEVPDALDDPLTA